MVTEMDARQDSKMSLVEELTRKAAAEERMARQENRSDFFTLNNRGRPEFEPVRFAKLLMSEHHFKTTMDNKTIFAFNPQKGIYEANGELVIQRELARLLDDESRKHQYPDVEFYIQAQTFFNRPEPDPNKLAVLNGTLHLDTDTLEPASPDNFITAQIPVTYDPAADCPRIRQFMQEIVMEPQVCMLQQTIGYCLLQAMPLHKSTMLIGGGENGKSTFIKLVEKFLGEDNVSHVALQVLNDNKFAAADLYGRLANVYADIGSKSLVNTGGFKTSTGGDKIRGEEKYKKSFAFNSYAKQIYSCNRIPETHDDTDAFFRRWNIITFPNQFKGDNCNLNMLQEISTSQELSGLLNLALEQLRNLMKAKVFCTNQTTEEIRQQYMRQSNSAKAYIEQELELAESPDAWIQKEILFAEYVAWCNHQNLLPLDKRTLTSNIQRIIPKAQEKLRRVEGKGKEGWAYLQFRSKQNQPLTDLLTPGDT